MGIEMMLRNVSWPISGLFLGPIAFGQGPITDRLSVTLPNTTWVGSQSLAPGTYTIKQLPTASNPRLLEFSSENGTKLETAITAIAAIGQNTRHDTSVILEQKGGQYHLKHIWIAGKTYGYELPVDESRQQASDTKAETVTLAAEFTPEPPLTANVAETALIAEARPEPPIEATPPPVAAAPPAPPEPNTPAESAATPAPTTVPESAATPPVAAPQSPAVADTPRAVDNERTPPPTTDPAANAQIAAQTPAMPETAANWPLLILIGSVSLLFGFLFRSDRTTAL